MSNVLHHLMSPVILDAQECGDVAGQGVAHAAHAAAGVPWLWPLVAAGLVLLAAMLGARLLRRARRSGGRGILLPRWAAVGLVTALLITLPLLSLHATHHLDVGTGDGAGQHCALAGIAHSIAGGLVTATPALAVLLFAILLLVIVAGREVSRTVPQPIARGPPALLSVA